MQSKKKRSPVPRPRNRGGKDMERQLGNPPAWKGKKGGMKGPVSETERKAQVATLEARGEKGKGRVRQVEDLAGKLKEKGGEVGNTPTIDSNLGLIRYCF